jgi:hypothetical protein
VFAAPLLLVKSGLKATTPEEPRSRISAFPPALNSTPNFAACLPLNQDSDSSSCVSVIGVWIRARFALLSET